MVEQVGLGGDVLTMRDRSTMLRELIDRGMDPLAANFQLAQLGIPPSRNAGLNEPEPEEFSYLGGGGDEASFLESVGTTLQSGAKSALEGASSIVDDYVSDDSSFADALDSVATAVGPSDERLQRQAARQEEIGFTGKVGDAIAGEAPVLAASIGAGAAAGSVVPGLGTVVGGLVGAGYGVLRMYDQGRDNVLRGKVAQKLGKSPDQVTDADIKAAGDLQLTDEEKGRVALAASTGALDAFPAGRILKMVAPGKVTGIAAKHLGRTVLREGGKIGLQEGAMEVGQELAMMALTDPQVREDIGKLPKGDIMEIGKLVAQTRGEELAISFLAGFGLGAGAGAPAAGIQQSRANAEREREIKTLVGVADQRGIDVAELEALAKDPEMVPKLSEVSSSINEMNNRLNQINREIEAAETSEAKQDLIEMRDVMEQRFNDAVDKGMGSLGVNFKDTKTVREDAKQREAAKRQEIADRSKSLGMELPKDTSVEEQKGMLDRLEGAAEKHRIAAQKYSASPKKKRLDELTAARDAEADVRAEIAQRAGKDPVAARTEYLDGLKQQELADQEARVARQDQDVRTEEESWWEERLLKDADTATPEGRKALKSKLTKQIRSAKKKAQDQPIRNAIAAKRKEYKEKDNISTPRQELLRIERDIAALEEKLNTPNPALVVAERIMQDLEKQDQAAQSSPQGGKAAGTPSGDTAVTGEGAAKPEPMATAPERAAAVSEAEPAKPAPPPAAPTIPEVDMTNVRQERLTDYDAARRAGDPNQMKTAAEAIVGDLGIPVNDETVAAFNGGPKTRSKAARAKAAREAAVLQGETVGMPAPAPEPADAGSAFNVAAFRAEPDHGEGREVDRQHRYRTLVNDLDLNTGTEEEVTDLLRQWTAEKNKEASATFDENGQLISAGTNGHENAVAIPLKDRDRVASMTHTHPYQTPMSLADIRVATFIGKPFSAILPDGQVTGITPVEGVTAAQIDDLGVRVYNIAAGVVRSGLDTVSLARVVQEAGLQLADYEGLIQYDRPMEGFNATERAEIDAIIDRAISDGARPDVVDGITEAGQGGGQAGRVAAEPAPEVEGAAAGFELARLANEKPTPPTPPNPEKVKALTAPVVEKAMADKSKRHLYKEIRNKNLLPQNLDKALAYAAGVASWQPTGAASVVMQMARLMYPRASLKPSTFMVDVNKGTGKKPKFVIHPDWQTRINAAWQFLREVGTDQDMGFKIEAYEMVQDGTFDNKWTLQNLSENRKMVRFLEIGPGDKSSFTRPMEDPSDTSQMLRDPKGNVFSEEALDRMRAAVAKMQANVYYLDQDAVAKLTPDDLISDKKLAEKQLKKQGDDIVPSVPGQTELTSAQEKFLRQQRFRQEKKLALLRRMARDHGDQPIGFQYKADNKGRLYADGTFTPQTGDAVKMVMRVGSPDGPLLKDMPMVDHSASGWQIATLMTGDAQAAGWYNLGPYVDPETGASLENQPLAEQDDYQKRDMYKVLMEDIKSEILEDAANGDPNAQAFKEVVFDAGLPFWKNEIKPAVIAVNYGGGRGNFEYRLKTVYGPYFAGMDPSLRSRVMLYASKKAHDQLMAKAPKVMKFQNWALKSLTALIKQVEGQKNAQNARPELSFSVGRDGTYQALKAKEASVFTEARDGEAHVGQTLDVDTQEVDPAATARSIFSQIIQGFDASVLHRAIDIYEQNNPGEFVASNHDSYITPQGKAGAMSAAARQAMKEIFTSDDGGYFDAPARLLREIEAQAAERGITIKKLRDPELFDEDGNFLFGDYNLDTIDSSVPLFVENLDDAAPAHTDVRGEMMPTAPAVPEESLARGIDYEARDTGETTGVRMDTSLPKAAQFAQDNRFPTGRDLKVALQEMALAAQEGDVDLRKNTPEVADRLVDFLTEDAQAALVNNANAVGWYGRTVTEAKKTLSELHPEIATDPEAEFKYIWALAVTSNGLKVDKNFELAEVAYRQMKETGAFPTKIGVGQAAKGINDGLAYYQRLVDKLGGWEAARDFMVKRQPVRDIERISGIKVSKEGKGTVLPGAVLLGPKIGGGFFSNLYGNFDELTMDRWFTRTLGRWRGNLIEYRPDMINAKRNELKNQLRSMSNAELNAVRKMMGDTPVRKAMSNKLYDDMAMAIAEKSTDPKWRNDLNKLPGGENIRLIGNAYAKYIDGQKEDPGGAKDREFIRGVFRRGLDKLRQNPDMSDLTMADLQALLWYPEKRLYDTAKKPEGQETLGYGNEEAPDYANAARKLVDRLGQAGRDGAGPVPSGAGAEPSFGPVFQDAEPFAGGINRPGDGSGVAERGVQPRPADGGAQYRDDGRNGLPAGGIPSQEVDAASYDEAMSAAAEFMGPVAAQVSRVPDRADIRRYLLDDGYSGYALDGDNIVGVFSTPGVSPKGSALQILADAVSKGGRRLDGFDTFLPKLYARGGFRAVARLPFNEEYAPSIDGDALANWDYDAMAPWNGGRPDVVFMVYDPANASPDTDTLITDYDQGSELQDSALDEAGLDYGAEAQEPLAMGFDTVRRVKAAPPKRGIAPPVEYKTPQTIRQRLSQNFADPNGTVSKLSNWVNKQGRAFGRQVMNRQAGLKQIERLAGMDEASIHDGMSKFAQMMTASTGRVAAMMSFGAPKWNTQQKIYEIDRNTKGLDEIFQFEGVEDYQNFQGWAYAKRDRDLIARGKGARMTDSLRAEYESISAADKARYDGMLAEYKKFNQALRQLMKDSGLISQKQMQELEADNEYVPMYRMFEDPEALGLGGIFSKDGFSHPDPGVKGMVVNAKKVGEPGGGDFGDLIEGIHNNAVAVMHAASQNLAHKQIYDFMSQNLTHEVTARKLTKKEKKAARKRGDQDAVRFMDDGKEFYWRAQGDPEWTGALQMALAGLSPTQLDGIDIALKKFNNFQRVVITSTPAFAIRSVIRDMGQAYVQTGTNPLNVAQNNATMLRESWNQYSENTQALMMAAGVAGYQMQGMPDVDAANLRRKIGAQESGMLHQIRTAFGKYERVVGGTELGARQSVYEGELEKTGDVVSAAYEALNMIDYNRKGASAAIQKLSYMVLFLNPRLQGLYRLFESSTGDGPTKYAKVSASLMARGVVLTGVGMAIRALTAMNDEDEERYRALSVADRATYFHIPIPGSDRFLRLPKPFEVGAAFATLPVAGIDAVAMGPEGMDDLGNMAMHVFMETFSFNPTPQAVRPVAEAMLNRNMFTGREIEGMRLQNLPKEERIDAQTSGIAQVISKYLTGSTVSPVMTQHLMSGYLGPLGMLGADITDATLAGAGIVPSRSEKVDGVFGALPGPLKMPADFTARWLFSTTEAERGTRYVSDFYDLHTKIRQYTSAINEAKRTGDLDRVNRLVEESADFRPMKSYMNKVNKQMSELNRQMRIAQNAPGLTDRERQDRMAMINLRKNSIARDAINKAYEMGAL